MKYKYFAYGSNMDPDDLREWCRKKGKSYPDMQLVDTAVLEGYALVFNYYSTSRGAGAANIVRSENNRVFGLLFEMDDDGLEVIRKKEGYPMVYGEIRVSVLHNGDKAQDVLTYKVVEGRETDRHQPPSGYYLNLIKKAARVHGFPEEYRTYLDSFEVQGN